MVQATGTAIADARRISDTVLRERADVVDAENRFPHEGVEALRERGLFGYLVPSRLGGGGGTLEGYAAIAGVLGEACLSTAMIWAMHSQQVAVLAEHGGGAHDRCLRAVASEGTLLASVTTEESKGAELLVADAPLVAESGGMRLRRHAPVVSYGEHAGAFLVTMRESEASRPDEVMLVLVERGDGRVAAAGVWEAMGMRATRSVPMDFDVWVPPGRQIGGDFRSVAVQTMVPFGHVGWAACWAGAARGAFVRTLGLLRASRGRRVSLSSELVLHRIARLRADLSVIELALDGNIQRLTRLRSGPDAGCALSRPSEQIATNTLKIVASERAVAIADGLMALCGLDGYVRGGFGGIERVARDLRSAPLMYGNDRLLGANGRLALLEHVPGFLRRTSTDETSS